VSAVAAAGDIACLAVRPEKIKDDTDVDTLEREFWRSITQFPPLYGADSPGSFFHDGVTASQRFLPHSRCR
jgi:hypothetical protein